jgi:hypothetical protein
VSRSRSAQGAVRCVAALIGLAAATPHPGSPAVVGGRFAIEHVSLIDGSGSPARPDVTILIEGRRIAAVASAAVAALPADTRRIDGTGLTALPGLWDMHVHVAARPNVTPPGGGALARLFIAAGVTGVRDMGGDMTVVREWRRARDAGDAVPLIVAAGPIVDGPKPIWPQSLPVATAADGRAAVDALTRLGADFVKVYNLVPRDAYFAIAEAAAAHHLPMVGHVPASVTAAEASDAGQRTIEHLSGVLEACSAQEPTRSDEILAASGAILATSGSAIADRIRSRMRLMLDTYDDRRCRDLFERFAVNHTLQTPTLASTRAFGRTAELDLADNPRLRFVPLSIRRMWTPENDFRLRGRNDVDVRNFADLLARAQQIVGEMHHAGVGILAGTDTPNPHVIPGFSLHDELELLVEAGLTNAEVLHAATAGAAAVANLEGVSSLLRAGEPADVVLLDADPLTDIRNVRRVVAVIVNGEFMSRERLELMLEETRLER